MKRIQRQRKKSKQLPWMFYIILTIAAMVLSFLAVRHWGVYFDWDTMSQTSKIDVLKRFPEDLSSSSPREGSPQTSQYPTHKAQEEPSVLSSLNTSTTKVIPTLHSSNLVLISEHKKDIKDANIVESTIHLREGKVWEAGVRPGCVYWWCYSHPQAPAPAGYQAKRSPKHQGLVDEVWLKKMRSNYPDHSAKFHKNKTIYYSEPKDHLDLTNVAFSYGTVHIFNPDEKTRQLIQSKLTREAIEKTKQFHILQQQVSNNNKKKKNQSTDQRKGDASYQSTDQRKGDASYQSTDQRKGDASYQLPCYESVDIKKKDSDDHYLCPKLIIHDSSMNVAKHCQGSVIRGGGIIERTLFFLAPHFPGNFFHIMNDNLIPLITDLQATPGCDSASLTCEPKAALAQFWFNSDRVAGGANKWWDVLFPSLFENTWSAESLLGGDSMTCVRRVSWGLGPRPFYTDLVEARVNALRALRTHTLRIHHVEARDSSQGASKKHPKVVFIRRYKKTKEQNPRGGGVSYNRVLGDPEELEAGFTSLGIALVTCCDFSASIKDMLEVVAGADVVVSLHGAGLINGIFAQSGSILIELHGGYGADDVIFRRLSQGRSGGYMKVRVDEKSDGHYIGKDRAKAVAQCAISLLKDSTCLPHVDIEESWRSSEMRPI